MRSSERFFFVGPGRFFLSSGRVGERPTRGDATRRRGGAARGRTVVSFAAAFATFATSSGCASATRASRVSSSEDDPPERRGARSVASAGAGSSAAARGAATIAGDPRRAYRCFPALGGVEGCDPSTLRRAGGGAAGMSIASIEGRGAARGEVCGRAERRVRGTRDPRSRRKQQQRRRNRSAFPRGDKPNIRNGRAVSAALFQDCSAVWNLESRSRGEL